MTDDADYAADLADREREQILAARRAQVPAQGRATCIDCRSAISDLRRKVGARRCLPCQINVERALRGLPPSSETP
jgi:RNA polymerase-binding transcription factor DksA